MRSSSRMFQRRSFSGTLSKGACSLDAIVAGGGEREVVGVWVGLGKEDMGREVGWVKEGYR